MEITAESKTTKEREIKDIFKDDETFEKAINEYENVYSVNRLRNILSNKTLGFIDFLHKDETFLELRLNIFGITSNKCNKETEEVETKKIIDTLKKICKIGFNTQTENLFEKNIRKNSNKILSEYENYLDSQEWKYMGLTKEDYSRKKPIVDIGKFLKKYSKLPKENAIIVKDLLIKDLSVSYMIHKGFYEMENYLLSEQMKYIDELILAKRELFNKSNPDEKEIIIKNEINIVKNNNKNYSRLFAYEKYLFTKYKFSSYNKFYQWIEEITEGTIDYLAIKKTYLEHKKRGTLTKHNFGN
jgi:hypothetical protein